MFLESSALPLSQSCDSIVMSLLRSAFPTMDGIRAGSWVSNTWPVWKLSKNVSNGWVSWFNWARLRCQWSNWFGTSVSCSFFNDLPETFFWGTKTKYQEWIGITCRAFHNAIAKLQRSYRLNHVGVRMRRGWHRPFNKALWLMLTLHIPAPQKLLSTAEFWSIFEVIKPRRTEL